MGSARRQALVWAASLAVTAVALWLAFEHARAYADFFHDDAYITLRYARNLATGAGLTWNPGEYIEGYTSLLHVLLLAPLLAAGVDGPSAARGLNLLALLVQCGAVGWLAVAWRSANSTPPDAPAPRGAPAPRPGRVLRAVVAGSLVLGSPALWVWIWGGLEGPVFAALLALAGCEYLRATSPDTPGGRLAVAGAFFGLAMITRPEGAAVAAAALVHLLARRAPPWKRAAVFAAWAGALPAAQVVVRLAVYGQWLPTSVAAKSVGLPRRWGAGFDYLLDFAGHQPVVVVVLVGALVARVAPGVARTASGRAALGFPLLAAVLVALAVAYAGGDHMPGHRLLLPLWPVAAIAAVVALAEIRPRALAVAAALALALAACTGGAYRQAFVEDPAAFVGRVVGISTAESFPNDSLIALNSVGATPWHAPRYRYLDMLGLNEPHIARRTIERFRTRWQRVPGHAKGDGAYVLDQRPDVIVLGPAHGTTADRPMFLSDIEIAEDPRFRDHYERRVERIDLGGLPGHERYGATRSGTLVFTYYVRRAARP